jgi:sugar lactone lactonase YvrE
MIAKKTIDTFLVVTLVAFHPTVAAGVSHWNALKQSYNLLTTVAGKGGNCKSDVNGWLQEFEGNSALKADLSSPHMAMADSAGNIYIADKDAHAVRKVDGRGVITTVAGTSSPGDGGDGVATRQALSSPNGVWVNKKGEFYILDLGNNKVRKVDAQGAMVTVFHDTAGMSTGRGLWVGASEDTVWYASGYQIKMWTKTGGITVYSTGFSGSLGNIVRDPGGFIVAADRSASLVYRLDKEGNKIVIAGNGGTSGGGDGYPALETGFDGVRGVWFLSDNTFFLATHEGSQVWYVDEDGVSHLFLNGRSGDGNHAGDGDNFQTPGFKISEARSVTVDYEGNVIVAENDCGYIRKVAKRSTAVLPGSSGREDASALLFANPAASGVTRLTWTGRVPGSPKVRIYDQRGRLENTPAACLETPGAHEIRWHSRNLPRGVYIVVLESSGKPVFRKSILIQ